MIWGKIKKVLPIVIIILVLLMGNGLYSVATPNKTIKTIEISFSHLTIREMGNSVLIELKGANFVFMKQNYYMVPTQIETLHFPFGTIINSVVCTPKNIHRQTLTKELMKTPDPKPVSEIINYTAFQKNVTPIAINFWYDYDAGTGLIHDHERGVILKIQMFPVQYHPSGNQIEWAESMNVIITYTEPQQSIGINEEYRLLVLTPTEFRNQLGALIEHKNSIGIPTKLVTLDEINDSTYFPATGRDDQEKIKYFIKNAIEHWGISFVLVVGDNLKFPARTTHVNTGYDDTEIFLSDLYYADIYDKKGNFSSWDTNGNNEFAEYNWGPSRLTDKVDLYPDVYLGRLACTNTTQVSICVNKIISYETNEAFRQDWFMNITVIGGDTFPGDIYPYSPIDEGEYMNQAVLDVMTGFIPTKLWASNHALSGSPSGVQILSNTLNKGAGFVDFSGHGGPELYGTMQHNNSRIWLPTPYGYYQSINIADLTNGNKLPIVVTGACSVGRYDITPNCFAWSFLSNPNGGGIGSFGATAIGWAYENEWVTKGLIEGLVYNIFKAYKEEGAVTLGEMWVKAIVNYLYLNMGVLDYKTLEEYQPFGDPSLIISGNSSRSPEKPTIPNGPTSGIIHKQYTYQTSVIDPDGDAVYYLFDWGDGEFSCFGPYASNVSVNAKHLWTKGGDFQIKVRAKDEHGVFGPWSDSLLVHIASPILNVTMNCGLGVNLKLKNTGDIAATNVNYTITVKGGIMNSINVSKNKILQNLPVNEEKIVRSGLIFGLGVIDIQATVTCDEGIPLEPISLEGVQMFFFTLKKPFFS